MWKKNSIPKRADIFTLGHRGFGIQNNYVCYVEKETAIQKGGYFTQTHRCLMFGINYGTPGPSGTSSANLKASACK